MEKRLGMRVRVCHYHCVTLPHTALLSPQELSRETAATISFAAIKRLKCANGAVKTKSLMFIARTLLHAFAIAINAQTALSFVM